MALADCTHESHPLIFITMPRAKNAVATLFTVVFVHPLLLAAQTDELSKCIADSRPHCLSRTGRREQTT